MAQTITTYSCTHTYTYDIDGRNFYLTISSDKNSAKLTATMDYRLPKHELYQVLNQPNYQDYIKEMIMLLDAAADHKGEAVLPNFNTRTENKEGTRVGYCLRIMEEMVEDFNKDSKDGY